MRYITDIFRGNVMVRNIAFLVIFLVAMYVFYNLGKNIGELVYYLSIR
ncbi:hypothetical protein SAMN05661086_01855 [Anaeromicropila populeti]|uniref:Uncharacterized protein n=1 Tax=Anaeromicropila populeti TaxID=37658 RepID=A0A1I6JPY0_9FIRM|nr:hypothetical protein SAMN05661086_01855 [Anaeromicropila populeti]